MRSLGSTYTTLGMRPGLRGVADAAKRMIAVPPAPTFLFLLCLIALPVQAQTLRYLGQQVVPHGHEFQGTTVGGLSGLDYDAATNRFVAISDDRSERQPARFYTLELDLAQFNTRAQPRFDGVRFIGVTKLRTPAGAVHAKASVDPEAIRFAGDGGYWWASEGNVKRGIPPAVEKVGAGGTALQRLRLPDHVLPAAGRGVRYNLAFESLALAEGKLYVGTENALAQDGPEADVGQPSPARILVFDAASGERLAEHVYQVDAVPVAPLLPGLYRINGLVELLGGEGMLLALERSYVMGVGNGARIYRLDMRLDMGLDMAAASAVADRPALAGSAYTPIAKTLLLDLATLGIALDNLEGMSWGPRAPNGKRTLILVSDNNFSARQATQFLAFDVSGPEPPGVEGAQ